jgi:DNA (cytosine-5)-methyltransferase 1
LDLGFVQAGFRVVSAFDNDADAVRVYSANFDHAAQQIDVTSPEFEAALTALEGKIDIVLGGFPCQGFSKAGPKREADPRNRLFLAMRNAVARLQPLAFVAENVDGVAQNFGGGYLKQIVRTFSDLGYETAHELLDAAEFGVPQYRRRLFFVGLRRDLQASFAFPVGECSAGPRNGDFLWSGRSTTGSKSPRTLAEAIADLPAVDTAPDHVLAKPPSPRDLEVLGKIGPGQKLCNVRHAPTSVYTWQIPEAFGDVTPEEVRVLECIAKHRRHRKYGSIPNGNPLPVEEIARLTGLNSVADICEGLLRKNYLKRLPSGFDLKGALFNSGIYKRPRLDEPAPTVLTNFGSCRYFAHPTEDRPFTVREVARMQGFPDSFRFGTEGGNAEAAYRLIGNAVPPPLARAIGSSLAGLFLNHEGLKGH